MLRGLEAQRSCSSNNSVQNTFVCASRHPPRRLGGLDAQRLGGSAVKLFENMRECWVTQERSKSGPRAAKSSNNECFWLVLRKFCEKCIF